MSKVESDGRDCFFACLWDRMRVVGMLSLKFRSWASCLLGGQ